MKVCDKSQENKDPNEPCNHEVFNCGDTMAYNSRVTLCHLKDNSETTIYDEISDALTGDKKIDFILYNNSNKNEELFVRDSFKFLMAFMT